MARIGVDTVQRALSFFGVRMARVPRCVEPNMPFDVFELALLKVIADKGEEFYFVQIVTKDGVMGNSLNPLICHYRLRGCLVEPMQDAFDTLKQKYGDQPQLDFRNVMIGDRDGVTEIHRLRRDAAVFHESFPGRERQDDESVQKQAKSEGLATETVRCRMQTFKSFFADLPVQHISMLYVGAEGIDDKIISSAFATGVFPPLINYEWTEMPVERRCDLKMKLLDHGYRFIDVGADTVCLRVEDARSAR